MLPIRRMFVAEEGSVDPVYWQTRRWRWLLCGLPAIVAATATVTLAVTAKNRNKHDVAQWYIMIAQDSIRAASNLAAQGKLDDAKVRRREAVAHAQEANLLNPHDDTYLLFLGEVLADQLLADQGDAVRAKVILSSLAPSDRLGNPRAHLSLAKLLMRQSMGTHGRLPADAERNLLRIADLPGDVGSQASALLGESYFNDRQFGFAIKYLGRAPYQSAQRVKLAISAARIGNSPLAESEARSCRDALDAKLKLDPADVNARISLTQCLVLLRDFPSAIQVCEAGLDPSLPQDAIDLLVSHRNYMYNLWLLSLEKDPPAPLPVRFEVLERALKVAPSDGRFIIRLTAFTDPKSKEGAAARIALQDQLLGGQNAALAHLVLGLYDWSEGKKEQARVHLNIAHDKFPGDAEIANNFAWMLAMSDPPDLDRALTAVNGALERMPNRPEFRDTRGMILVKMERWQEAISDLEMALGSGRYSDLTNIHTALANAYEKLGNPKLAELHRKKAEEASKNKKNK